MTATPCVVNLTFRVSLMFDVLHVIYSVYAQTMPIEQATPVVTVVTVFFAVS